VRLSLASWGATALVLTCVPSALRAADSDVRPSSIGYLTARAKRVSVLGDATSFAVRRAADGSMAFEGPLPARSADPGTNDMVAEGDFSALTETGRFYVDVPGVGRSVEFPIGDDVFRRPFIAAMLGFYGWRCGTAVSFAFSGDRFGHVACHLGDGYLDYLGQAGAMRDGKGGWHDAGDFGKYTGNAGFTVGMMLAAFERHPGGVTQAPLPIPEAGGTLPDVLDEVRFELEWMLKMIYGAGDGRVSHKLTALSFEAFIAPEADTQTRYFVPFSSAATADFAAALALASRVYRPYDAAFADTCLAAARTAYAFLTANTANTPPDQTAFTTGGYATSDPDDRLWAAAEMWETTGEAAPLADLEARINAVSATATLVAADFDWGSVRNLGLFTYLLSAREGRTPAIVDRVRTSALAAADAVTAAHDASRYGRGVMNYYWGSNGSVARTAMLLAVANRLTGAAGYLDVAADQLAYLFGRNQYNRSQVTGLGIDPPLHPHHRPSAADAVAAPYPGLLVGGGTTATGWMDNQDMYMVNEVAINWNGALVYALALFLPEGAWPPPQSEIDGGAGGDGGAVTDAAPDARADVLAPRNGGCGCAAAPSSSAASGTALAMFALLAAAVLAARTGRAASRPRRRDRAPQERVASRSHR
jgi:endoglucanase